MTFNPTSLGEGKKGSQPLLFGQAVGGGEKSNARRQIIRAFGNQVIKGLKNNDQDISPALYSKNILGPFRTANNAGDVVTRNITPTNIKYGREANQVNGNNISRLSPSYGGMNRNGGAMYAGNPKYIYDGSDYIRFRKLQAINRNFNDTSYGGDQNNQSQSVIRHVRH